jgi:hypothetical protein
MSEQVDTRFDDLQFDWRNPASGAGAEKEITDGPDMTPVESPIIAAMPTGAEPIITLPGASMKAPIISTHPSATIPGTGASEAPEFEPGYGTVECPCCHANLRLINLQFTLRGRKV